MDETINFHEIERDSPVNSFSFECGQVLTGPAVQSIHPHMLFGFHYLTTVTHAAGHALLRAVVKNYKHVIVIGLL